MSEDVDQAERIGRKRAQLVTASAVLFVASQAMSYSGHAMAPRPDHLRVIAWAVWAAVLLMILAGWGGWAQRPGVRRLLDDDVTRDHRRRSMAAGFWVAMGTAALIYVLAFFSEVSAQEAGRLVITFGIASALLWFARLERRAYRV